MIRTVLFRIYNSNIYNFFKKGIITVQRLDKFIHVSRLSQVAIAVCKSRRN